MIQRIFEPFYRSAAGGNRQGLGLYIAHQIAHAHGGTLEVTSMSAETRFVLKVPTLA